MEDLKWVCYLHPSASIMAALPGYRPECNVGENPL